ncbi:MAG: sulfatase-like hydrolase/transferase [Verrucomicrobiales bacterium]|nr:sulfatase-like hydrolase/transferase [Verrucomicrobiales bacterium]
MNRQQRFHASGRPHPSILGWLACPGFVSVARPLAIIGALLLSACWGMPRTVAAERPDILLIMPDQMRGDCLSILGHPVVRTPQMDSLAREGMLFRRAYSPVPSCIPARFALLTGMSPQASGIVGFAARRIDTPTLPGLLAGSGYTTALVGRYMHQVPASGDCGYQVQVLGSTHVDNDDYDRHLQQVVPDSGGIRALVRKLDLNYNLWPAAPWPLEEALHPTTWIVGQSRRVVRETPAEKPLFLTTSFYAPHPPLFPPEEYFGACLKADLPAPAHGDWVDWEALSPKGDRNGHRVLLEGETLRRAQAGYYGLINHLDHEIAPLIAEFKARSERAGRPWIILVTSDHGEMMGDHGYFRKCEPYEGSANIPFIIAGSPSLGFRAGGRCSQPVSLEDILPTLSALAHVDEPVGVDGANLTAALRGEGPVPRAWLHFEHAPCYSKAQAFHALTDGHFKYIWRSEDGSEQLFDLDEDPREEHDLSKSPLVESWRRRLIERLAGRPEGFSDGNRLIAGRPYPPVQKRQAVSLQSNHE